ncbi:MAG: two-component regulator propeller domain-containing protein [Flammeovirgaceae bacterium]
MEQLKLYKNLASCGLFCLLLLSFVNLIGQARSFRFKGFSLEDGLSQNTIEAITQDAKGFLWFATQDGLNRFDGYRFRTFVNRETDTNTLALNWVYTVKYSPAECLWIGTAGKGLDRFDLKTEQFTHFPLPKDEGGSIYCILEESDGLLWLGTDDGLYQFDPATQVFTKISHETNAPYTLSDDHVLSITKGANHQIWLGTRNGLICYDASKQKYIHYLNVSMPTLTLSHDQVDAVYYLADHQELWIGTYGGLDIFNLDDSTMTHYRATSSSSLPDNRVQELYRDSQGRMWVGTYRGLSLTQRNNDQLRFSNHYAANGVRFSLNNDRISSIFEDHTNTIWIGTYFGGVNKYDVSCNRFELYTVIPQKRFSLSDQIIRSVVKDTTGQIWVGTNKGLNRIHPITKEVTVYQASTSPNTGLSSNVIRSLALSAQQKLWIGTGDAGLNVLDFATTKIRRIPLKNKQGQVLNGLDIRTLLEDKNGILWVGTNLNGLFRFDPKTNQWTQFDESADGISSNRITALFTQDGQRIWIGTWQGINCFDLTTGTFQTFTKEQYPTLSSNFIKTIWQDEQQRIWVGTAGLGLNLLTDSSTGSFKTFTTADGLPNNFIYSILGDQQNRLWISTNRGLSNFNPETGKFRNYNIRDGLQDYEFNTGAYAKAKDGELFFGGIKGLNAFYPDSLKDNLTPALPAITNIKLFHQAIPIRNQSNDSMFTLKSSSPYLDTLILEYAQNVLTIEFSAMHYADLKKNRFKYQLVGFDPNWIVAEKDRHSVTYTSLSPGNYTFKLKASNNDGYWSKQEATLFIQVKAPFWLTPWFFIFIALLVLGLFATFYKLRLRRIKLQKQALERMVVKRTNEIAMQNEELAQSRDELTTINENLAATKEQLEYALVKEKDNLRELETAYETLEEREKKLMESEEQLRQHSEELLISNENLQLLTKYLEESVEREKDARLEIEEAHEELKRTQNQLIASEKLAALGELVASVAHEVNTPLGAIKSSIGTISLALSSAFPHFMSFMNLLDQPEQLLFFKLLDKGLKAEKLSSKEVRNVRKHLTTQLEALDLPHSRHFVQQLITAGIRDEVEEFLPLLRHELADKMIAAVEQLTKIQSGISIIQLATDKASKVVYALKNYARFDQKAQKTEALIQDGLETALILYNNYLKQGINITKNIQALPPIYCYPDELNQVWVNLIYNSLQAMEFQGELGIQLSQENQQAIIHISDTGKGIPEQDRDQIFEPFFTTKPTGEGTGLGLSIVQQIIEKHNGTITFESEVGKGTTFIVKLPMD